MRLAPLLLLIAACTPAATANEPTPAPTTPPAAASDPAAICADYQARLNELADGAPQLRGQAVLRQHDEPLVAGSPPIPEDERDAADDSIVISNRDVAPTIVVATPAPPPPPISPSALPPGGSVVGGGAPPPPSPSELKKKQQVIRIEAPVAEHVYLDAQAGTPLSYVVAVRDALPAGTRTSLIVRRTADELGATLRAVMPRTPAAVAELMPDPYSGESARLLIQSAGSCQAVLQAFAPAMEVGEGLDTVAPATARALASCKCELADLDTYVTLMTALLLPMPEVGAVTVRDDVLDALPKDATVDDLVRALIL